MSSGSWRRRSSSTTRVATRLQDPARAEICHTAVDKGFIDYRGHHWKRLKITLFKPARQAAAVRVVLRTD